MANPFTNGYIEPSTPSNYLKLTEGSHLFRILTPKSEVLSYFVEYTENPNDKSKNIKIVTRDNGDGKQPAGTKKVWACLVYNYDQDKVQIAEFPQKSIQNWLFTIASGKIKNDWTKFDIQITRTGQALDTEYTPIMGDTCDLEPELVKEINKQKDLISLKAMEYGKDPFDTNFVLNESISVQDEDLPNVEDIDLSQATMPF